MFAVAIGLNFQAICLAFSEKAALKVQTWWTVTFLRWLPVQVLSYDVSDFFLLSATDLKLQHRLLACIREFLSPQGNQGVWTVNVAMRHYPNPFRAWEWKH